MNQAILIAILSRESKEKTQTQSPEAKIEPDGEISKDRERGKIPYTMFSIFLFVCVCLFLF